MTVLWGGLARGPGIRLNKSGRNNLQQVAKMLRHSDEKPTFVTSDHC